MTDTRPMFTLGAFAIIFDVEGRVLLSHRKDMDAWNLPGGGLEPGELPNEGVIREVREETGLIVVVERLVGVYGKPRRSDLVFSFVCRVIGGDLCETDESDSCCWYDPNLLPSNTLLRHVERIWDAILGESQPVIRRQGVAKTTA